MRTEAFLAALALTILLVGTSLQAQETDGVTLDIQADTAGNWQVLVAVEDGLSAGLAAFAFDVIGTGDVQVLSSLNESPAGFPLPDGAGFVVDRTDGVLGVGIAAAQPFDYPEPPTGGADPVLDALVVQGVGQRGWVLLASGTFSGTLGTLEVVPNASTGWLLLNGPTGTGLQYTDDWFGPNHVVTPEVSYDSVVIPEPATFGLLTLGSLVAALRRRRR